MSAAPDTRPSVAHPAWCWPTLCRTDVDGTVYHRGIVVEASTLSVDIEAADDGPASAIVQGLDGERLGPVALANLAAQLVRAAALLTASSGGCTP